MMKQESGVAVGWPLNLGHDTTGWPLGLRLRLMHEDLQWPRRPELARSSSRMSSDSSSLDTASTKSFFQDKSISLGALIGLPVLDNAVSRYRRHHQQLHYRALLSPGTTPLLTPTGAAGVQISSDGVVNRPQSRLHRHSSTNQRGPWTAQAAPSAASSAGWSLLSVLSCARVPAPIEAPENEAQIAPLVTRGWHPGTGVQEYSELPQLHESHENGGPPPPMALSRNPSQQQQGEHQEQCSPARKLYDNITFEGDELETSNTLFRSSSTTNRLLSDGASTEWNPLFASDPIPAPKDEEFNDNFNDNWRPGVTIADVHCAHRRSLEEQRASLPGDAVMAYTGGGYNHDSDSLLYYTEGNRVRIECPTSMSFCIDLGKWQQQQKLSKVKAQQLVDSFDTIEADDRLNCMASSEQPPPRDSSKNNAVSAFVYRMVCCRSTPTTRNRCS